VAKANVRVSRESSNSEIPNHSSSSPPSPAPSPSSLSSGALPPGEDISTIHENEEFTAELTRIAQLSAAGNFSRKKNKLRFTKNRTKLKSQTNLFSDRFYQRNKFSEKNYAVQKIHRKIK
jgi:hypothetical protein